MCSFQPMTVRSIDNAQKYPQRITTWITSIQQAHAQQPPPTVHLSRPMPPAEQLMQVWPSEFETALKTVSAHRNDSMSTYALRYTSKHTALGVLGKPHNPGRKPVEQVMLVRLLARFLRFHSKTSRVP